MGGKRLLTLAATPIGNLDDCSTRLRLQLASADLVYAEDTRHARKLLSHLAITKRLRSFHDHSPPSVLQQIGGFLEAGKHILYISDAGTPVLNDPGYELVQLAIRLNVEVDHLPGPCAAINALVLSGLPADAFCFLGFFPSKPSKKEALLQQLPQLNMTAIFFESPQRIRHTLSFLEERLGKVPMALCRELTKRHQQILRGTAKEINSALKVEKGEMVLVIGKADQVGHSLTLEEREVQLRESGMKPNQIAKALAGEFRIPKREIYARLTQNRDGHS